MSEETLTYVAYFYVYILPILFLLVLAGFLSERSLRKQIESFRENDDKTICFWKKAYEEEVNFNNHMFNLEREVITEPIEENNE